MEQMIFSEKNHRKQLLRSLFDRYNIIHPITPPHISPATLHINKINKTQQPTHSKHLPKFATSLTKAATTHRIRSLRPHSPHDTLLWFHLRTSYYQKVTKRSIYRVQTTSMKLLIFVLLATITNTTSFSLHTAKALHRHSSPHTSTTTLHLSAPSNEVDPKQISPQSLSFIGDSVYELHVRTHYLLPARRTTEYRKLVENGVRAEVSNSDFEKGHFAS